MEKASRWMINFLLGKKEEKHKKKEISLGEKNVTTSSASAPSTPTYHKRRWSFGKSSNRKEKGHESSKSLEHITRRASVSWECANPPQKLSLSLAVPKAAKKIQVPKQSIDKIWKAVEDVAATRIQAAFRSYLARKALCALRGLVKLQALVRGYLVRKQAAATLRGMHALMAIQVRARFQRIQLADEESQLFVRNQSSRQSTIRQNFFRDNGLMGSYGVNLQDATGVNLYEARRSLKDKHFSLNHPRVERRHKTSYSGELPVSKRKHHSDELSFPSEQNSPRAHFTSRTIPGRASFTCQQPDYMPISYHHPFSANYMLETESSRAKVRSQSEPKQRVKRSKYPQAQSSSTHSRSHSHDSQSHPQESQDSWLVKLYRSARPNSNDRDAMKAGSGRHSNYSKFVVSYEPHLNLY